MFDEMVESTSNAKKRTNKRYTVIVSGIVQAVIIGVLILLPLIYTQVLPTTMMASMLVAPPPPAAPPPPPPPAQVVHIKPTAHLIQSGHLVAPHEIPHQVNIIKEDAPPPDISSAGVQGGVVGGVPGGQIGGVLGGIIGGSSTVAPPPPPKVETPKRIPVGGNVMAAKRIDHVVPSYPAMARQLHIQGTVRIHAIISKEGRVTEVTVISSPSPLLIQAAKDAVLQFRYSPTTLNSEPVDVDTTIDVVFTLGG